MKYCRRCDLAFCERHAHHHVSIEASAGHSPLEHDERAEFCSVCVGIYVPGQEEVKQ
jgi:hypothetical protein